MLVTSGLSFIIGGFFMLDPLDFCTDLRGGVAGALKCKLDDRADRSLWTAELSKVENMPPQAPSEREKGSPQGRPDTPRTDTPITWYTHIN